MIFSVKFTTVLILTTLTLIQLNDAVNNDKTQDAKCLLPMEAGPCRMNLKRFYYNAKTDTCEEFKFGGCMGNDNKFGFKKTCEEACKKSVTKSTTVTSSATEKTPSTSTTKPLKVETVNGVSSKGAATAAKPAADHGTTKQLQSEAVNRVPSKGAATTAKPAIDHRTTVKPVTNTFASKVTITTKPPK